MQLASFDAGNGAQSLLSDGQFYLKPKLFGLHRGQTCFSLSQVGNLRELKTEKALNLVELIADRIHLGGHGCERILCK